MIQLLNWDSNFFEIKIGEIKAFSNMQFRKSLEIALAEEYNLIYLFTDETFPINKDLLIEFGGKLVDRKVIFCKENLQPHANLCTNIEEYDSTEISPQLLSLALESGKYSRFKLEDKFKNGEFERLYTEWIIKSVKREITDYVFVAKHQGIVVGMVTLAIKGDEAHIGLIAVSNSQQGRGYGRQLINKCIKTAIIRNCLKIIVPTQIDNEDACAFYKANDFSIKEITNIYHFWIKVNK